MPLIDLYARFLCVATLPPVIPSVVEESRGNENVRLILPFLPSPKWRRECHAVTGEDCCLIFYTSILIRLKVNYKTSILFSLNFATLNSASFPASWGSQGVMYTLARKPRLLGKPRIYYKVEESRGNENGWLIFSFRNRLEETNAGSNKK